MNDTIVIIVVLQAALSHMLGLATKVYTQLHTAHYTLKI